LHHVIEKYLSVFDDPTTPKEVRALRDVISSNMKELHNFHAK
jgi:hypothetical protein